MNARPAGRTALLVAAVVGTVHAGFSLYWGLGGTALLATLGARLLDTFSGLQWVLLPVGAVKLVAAWVPEVLRRAGWPARRPMRSACWLGATVLVLWGGANTVVGLLVLGGVIRPDGGYDRAGMVGHALLWDPLFLVWGVALAAGLYLTRGVALRPPAAAG